MKEAMKLALEALGKSIDNCAANVQHREAIKALEEALKQEQGESVAWICNGVNNTHDIEFDENDVNALPVGTMLYTTPLAKQEPVAEPHKGEPKKDLMFSTVAMQKRHSERIERTVATLERVKQEQLAALAKQEQDVPEVCFGNIKQEQGEPVAWGVIASNTGRLCQVELDFAEVEDLSPKWVMPLYTTPQQRKPLTYEQAEFESVFKLPANCTKFAGGYAPTSYNAWDAQTFCARWEGWKTRAAHGIKG